jgi:DUF1009 family protein
MSSDVPEALAIIAGNGAYPYLLAQSAKQQGVGRVLAVAFRRETSPRIEQHADAVEWIRLGRYGEMLERLKTSGIDRAVMAGQISPTHLFRLRLDAKMSELLKRLEHRNAETIFGAIGEDLKALGIDLLPASRFMEKHMPEPGVLSSRPPTDAERADIELGLQVARTTSALEVGQTVVVKQGTIIAVEAFEGTDRTIRRAGRLAGPGCVVAKVAKPGHDMRFDIPVVGLRTMNVLRRARATAMALESGRAILLEREDVINAADRMGLAFVVVEPE